MAELTNFYDEENTRGLLASLTFTNTMDSGADPAKILGSALSANTKYLIVARALLGSNSVTVRQQIRVATDDDSAIASKSEAVIEFEQTGAEEDLSYLFVHSYTTDASPADIEFQIAEGSGTSDVEIDQSSLWLLDLDAIGTEGTDYFEDINAATGSEIADDGGLSVEACFGSGFHRHDRPVVGIQGGTFLPDGDTPRVPLALYTFTFRDCEVSARVERGPYVRVEGRVERLISDASSKTAESVRW